MDINSVVIIGIIEGSVESIPDGCKFTLKNDRAFGKEKDIIKIPCAAFKKTSEHILKYCKDNSKICVEGSLEYNTIQNFMYVKAHMVSFLGTGYQEEKKSEYTSKDGGW